jgi:hypothetical protein
MRIYVAGEVPRWESIARGMMKNFLGPKAFLLPRLYKEIEAATRELVAEGRSMEVILPLPDPWVDKLEPHAFVEYVRSEIKKADAVLTIFTPPGIAVGFESQFAAELGKPQTVLLPAETRIPRWLKAMPGVVHIGRIGEVGMREVLKELTGATHQAGHEFGHYV